jgi:fatty acid desaturase
MDAMDAESRLKAQIRGDLPSAAFARDPRRLWLLGALVASIAALSTSVATLPVPWPVALVASAAIGALYASLFFLGHDIAHGAVIASRRAQTCLMYVTFLICCTSPHFFRYWHNHAHHHHTNIASYDPDMFGTLEQFERKRLSQFVARFAPGSGHWLSLVYLFTFFTAHAQGVLWCNSKTPPFDGMSRLRAKGETLAMAACWVAIGVVGGLWATCFVVVIPMLVANFILMSFIVTNHMLRPLTADRRRTLETTMSVTTWRLVDRIFLNFSHHVEHHLFPGVSSRFYPAIRRSLQRHASDSYLAPPHLTALRAVFSTPRLYADRETLIDPSSRARTSLRDIETSLRDGGRGRIAPMPS